MNGKGSSPRNNHSPEFRKNYQAVKWSPTRRESRAKRAGWWTRQILGEKPAAGTTSPNP